MIPQANGHDRTRAMSTSPLVENRKREAEAFKQVAQAAQARWIKFGLGS